MIINYSTKKNLLKFFSRVKKKRKKIIIKRDEVHTLMKEQQFWYFLKINFQEEPVRRVI